MLSVRKLIRIVTVALLINGPVTAEDGNFNPRDLSGHWDRTSELETFSNTPGSFNPRGRTLERPQDIDEAPFTAAGKKQFETSRPGYGPRVTLERNDPHGRCVPVGLVRNLLVEEIHPHDTFEIVQTPGRILQFFEYRHDWREIWMDGRKLPASDDWFPKFNGWSVGHWEGDTLVVKSIGFDDRTWLDKLGYPHSENVQVEERYRRLDANTLELTLTVSDPEMYTRPWKSDRKLFQLVREKSQGYDEQIYCVPEEEFSFQHIIETGNYIEKSE